MPEVKKIQLFTATSPKGLFSVTSPPGTSSEQRLKQSEEPITNFMMFGNYHSIGSIVIASLLYNLIVVVDGERQPWKSNNGMVFITI